MSDKKSKLVYSTDKTVFPEKSHTKKALYKNDRPAHHKVKVRLERKGRGGKTVTVIEGLHMSHKEKEAFLKQLKARLGTGGTVKNTSLEIQGDHRDSLMSVLETLCCRTGS